jgi:hypothetical protein
MLMMDVAVPFGDDISMNTPRVLADAVLWYGGGCFTFTSDLGWNAYLHEREWG